MQVPVSSPIKPYCWHTKASCNEWNQQQLGNFHFRSTLSTCNHYAFPYFIKLNQILYMLSIDSAVVSFCRYKFSNIALIHIQLQCGPNAQRDGRPAKHRWRPLFNAAKFGWRPLLDCRAVTLPRRDTRWNTMGCPKPAKRSQPLVGRSSPYCKDMWRSYCCLTSFFPIVDKCLSCEDIARQSCAMVLRWRFFCIIFVSCISSEPLAAHFRPAF